jgi:branched-chain amino acid aminotransferase
MPPSPTSFLVHNGVLRPAGEAIVTASDGLSVGRGLFETLAAYRGRPFLAAAHFARLRRGAEVLGIPCPADDLFLEAFASALSANGFTEAGKTRLRLNVSSPADGSENWWVEATPPPSHPATARVVTGPFFRNERSPLAGFKTVNYGDNLVAQRHAHAAGADEALFANTRGEVCEGTWSNVFLLVEGRWMTPPPSSGCLPGVTRAVVLELFAELDLPVSESTLSIDGLDRVESAFLTSSLREIQPVAVMDGRELRSSGTVEALMEAFRARVERGN